MKKKTIIPENSDPKRHLIEAAGVLMKVVKTPANLLEFMSESLQWFEYIEGKDLYYDTRMIIDCIIQPWFADTINPINKIADGIQQIADETGYREYAIFFSRLVQSFAIDLKNGIPGDFDKHLLTIKAFNQVGQYIWEYERERRTKKRPDLSKQPF